MGFCHFVRMTFLDLEKVMTLSLSLSAPQGTSHRMGTAASRWALGTAGATATRAAWEDTVITVSVNSALLTRSCILYRVNAAELCLTPIALK